MSGRRDGDDSKVLNWAKPAGLLALIASAGAAVGQPVPAQPDASVAAPAPAPAAATTPPTEGKCGLLLDSPDGQGQFEERAEVRPLSQTGPGKIFMVDAPLGAGVMCGRSSVLPMPYDVQIAMTGHDFYIIDKQSDRIGVLEMNEGLAEYRMLKGALSTDEETLLQQRLEAMQGIAAAMAP